MFTDTHSHIHFRQHFPDIEDIIGRSREAGVTNQIIVGCTVKDSLEALRFVQHHGDQNFYSTLGVHPHNADEWNPRILDKFKQIATSEQKICALGEMGLDYFRNFQPKELQQETFRGQLRLARELDLPVVVHVREAWEDAFTILKEEGNTKVILHCFSGGMAEAEQAWSRGYHTSFSGVLTYPKNEVLREVAERAPSQYLLLETDCPYLPPQTYRGKRNEPAFLVETAKELAKVRGVSLEQIAETTTANAAKLFRFPLEASA